jgi:hypothetical protein
MCEFNFSLSLALLMFVDWRSMGVIFFQWLQLFNEVALEPRIRSIWQFWQAGARR